MDTPSRPGDPGSAPVAVLDRLRAAMNAHDLEAFVACFAPDHRSEQPAHPDRAFRGQEQVRANWGRVFAAVPDFRPTWWPAPSGPTPSGRSRPGTASGATARRSRCAA